MLLNLSEVLCQDVEHFCGVLLVHFEQLPQSISPKFDVSRSARLEGIVCPLHHLKEAKIAFYSGL
jgi:hypothetical protein